MRTIIIAIAAGIALLPAGFAPAKGAELPPPPIAQAPGRAMVPGCRDVWVCGPRGGPHDCGWRQICPPGCPGPYMCYPLYGAYGPYGGTPYWGAYTPAGWGFR
jgi:hypothetical protein